LVNGMRCEFCDKNRRLLAKMLVYSEEAAYECSETRVMCEDCLGLFGVDLRRVFQAFIQPQDER